MSEATRKMKTLITNYARTQTNLYIAVNCNTSDSYEREIVANEARIALQKHLSAVINERVILPKEIFK